ncbi:MAG: SDR family oxidoreductase [Acetobacteraceae bacterium]|nr:SDR family oxidoreductase [Acetobacteraceae bacterium]
MDLQLAGKKALVMGGSKGLGLASAEALAAEGCAIALSSRDPAAAAAALAERFGVAVHAIAADAGSAAAIDTLAEQAAARLGGVDIVILNHGGPPPCTAVEMTAEQLDSWYRIIVAHPIRLAMQLLPAMRAQKFGRIIAVGSAGMIQPIPNLALSNTLRAAIVGWTKTLSSEVAIDGVTVNVLAPGAIRTDRSLQTAGANAAREGIGAEEWIRRRAANIPAGRYGTPTEFGALAAFLASPLASYVTGTVMRADGGMVRSVG